LGLPGALLWNVRFTAIISEPGWELSQQEPRRGLGIRNIRGRKMAARVTSLRRALASIRRAKHKKATRKDIDKLTVKARQMRLKKVVAAAGGK